MSTPSAAGTVPRTLNPKGVCRMTDLPSGVKIYPTSTGINLSFNDLVARLPKKALELFEATLEAALPDTVAYVFGISSDGSVTIEPDADAIEDPEGYARVQLTTASLAANLAEVFNDALEEGTFLVNQSAE